MSDMSPSLRRFLIPRHLPEYQAIVDKLETRSFPSGQHHKKTACMDEHLYLHPGGQPVLTHIQRRRTAYGESERIIEHQGRLRASEPLRETTFCAPHTPTYGGIRPPGPSDSEALIDHLLDTADPLRLVRHSYETGHIDVFLDRFEGLVLADVDVLATDDPFVRPSWLPDGAIEVTDHLSYHHLARALQYVNRIRHESRMFTSYQFNGDIPIELLILVGSSSLAKQQAMEIVRSYDPTLVRAVPALIPLVLDQLDRSCFQNYIHEPNLGFIEVALAMQAGYEDAHLEQAALQQQCGVVIDFAFPDFARRFDGDLKQLAGPFKHGRGVLSGDHPTGLKYLFERYHDVLAIGPFSEAMHHEVDPEGRESYEPVAREEALSEQIWGPHVHSYSLLQTGGFIRKARPQTWAEVIEHLLYHLEQLRSWPL